MLVYLSIAAFLNLLFMTPLPSSVCVRFKMASAYMRGWFIVDFMSTVPLDRIAMLFVPPQEVQRGVFWVCSLCVLYVCSGRQLCLLYLLCVTFMGWFALLYAHVCLCALCAGCWLAWVASGPGSAAVPPFETHATSKAGTGNGHGECVVVCAVCCLLCAGFAVCCF